MTNDTRALCDELAEALCCQLIRDLAAARDALEAWTEYFTENEQPTAKSFCMKEYKSARDAYSNACTVMAVLRRPAHYVHPMPRSEPGGPTDEELMTVFWEHQNGMEEIWACDWPTAARAVLARWGNSQAILDS